MTSLIAASFFVLLSAASPQNQAYRAPLYFEPNLGQFDSRIRFLARGPVYRAWITDSELILEPNAAASVASARIHFSKDQKTPRKTQGLDKLPGISNYFIGNRPERWTENVPSFAKAKLEDIYKGVDIVFYATPDQQIEYDLIIKPGADPAQISIDFDPRFKLRTDPQGLITMDLPEGSIQHRVPLMHQGSVRVPYKAALSGNSLKFEIEKYDTTRTLTVDPVVIYSTFTLGAAGDTPEGLAIDPAGGIYIAGQTKSAELPVLFFETLPKFSDTDCFVTKFNAVADRVYSTYLGGELGEACSGIAVDPTGAAYVTGATFSYQFPIRAAFQTQPGGIFIAKLSAQPTPGTGHSLVYSTYFQEQENVAGPRIAVDPTGAAYVATTTSRNSIPVLRAAQPARAGDFDLVVLKIAAAPTAGVYNRVYTTYLGGSGADFSPVISADSDGGAYIGARTRSFNFPTLNAFQNSMAGETCGTVTKIVATPDSSGNYPFAYSSYLCGTAYGSLGDAVTAIAVDSAFNAYVAGPVSSTDFPLRKPIADSPGGAFLTKISAQKTDLQYPILFSTLLGGVNRRTTPAAIATGAGGVAAVAGESNANGAEQFPTVDPPYTTQNPVALSAFAAKYDSVNSAAIFSTVFAYGRSSGVAIDAAGNTYLTGVVSDFNQDIYNGTPMPSAGGGGFLMKLGAQPSPVTINVISSPPGMDLTVSGNGCRPGVYRAPTGFRWPAGRSCTITVADQETTSYRFLFRTWGDGSTATSRVITAASTPASVQLNFDTEYRLEILVSPAGAGAVTPAVSAFYKPGSIVPLTATPNPGYAFRAWIGASAIGNLSAASTNLTMINPQQILAQFGAATVNNNGLLFVPVTPCRVADTRNPTGPLGQPALAANATRSFPVPSGPCGIPANAAAYSVNVTVVPKTTLGYLSIWPSGTAQPVVSTLNALDGRVKANAAIVPAGTNGAVSVYVTDVTEFILDINGYFALPPQTGGLMFYSVAPCRILDTRLANGALGGPSLAPATNRAIPIQQSNCGIPATAKAYSLNTTVVPSNPLGYLSIWPTGSTQPVVSTLNALTGTIVANAAIVPAGPDAAGSIDVFATDKTHLLIDVNGYFAEPGSANGQKFYTLTPCRIYDSRQPSKFFPGPLATSYAQGYVFDIQPPPFPGEPKNPCTISAAAQTYSLSTTVIPTSGPFGYLTIYPDGSGAPPAVSVLNAINGAITSNAAIVPAGIIGRIDAFLTNPAHLLIDINGYFAP